MSVWDIVTKCNLILKRVSLDSPEVYESVYQEIEVSDPSKSELMPKPYDPEKDPSNPKNNPVDDQDALVVTSKPPAATASSALRQALSSSNLPAHQELVRSLDRINARNIQAAAMVEGKRRHAQYLKEHRVLPDGGEISDRSDLLKTVESLSHSKTEVSSVENIFDTSLDSPPALVIDESGYLDPELVDRASENLEVGANTLNSAVPATAIVVTSANELIDSVTQSDICKPAVTEPSPKIPLSSGTGEGAPESNIDPMEDPALGQSSSDSGLAENVSSHSVIGGDNIPMDSEDNSVSRGDSTDNVSEETTSKRKSSSSKLSALGRKRRIGPKSKTRLRVVEPSAPDSIPVPKKSKRIALIAAALHNRPIISIPRVKIPLTGISRSQNVEPAKNAISRSPSVTPAENAISRSQSVEPAEVAQPPLVSQFGGIITPVDSRMLALHARPHVRKRDEKYQIRLKKIFRRSWAKLAEDHEKLIDLTRPIIKQVANATKLRFEPKSEDHKAEMDIHLKMFDDQLTGEIPRRFRDPWVWLPSWDREHVIDHQHFPDGDYREGYYPVRPHPDYASVPVGQRLIERPWLDSRSSLRSLVSAGSGFAILPQDYDEILRLVIRVIAKKPNDTLEGLTNRLGALKRILAYSFFPMLYDEEFGSFLSSAYGDFVTLHGYSFQLERLQAIQRIIRYQLTDCVPADLIVRWTSFNFDDFVKAVADGFRAICRSDRLKRERNHMKSLGAGDLFITDFNATRHGRTPSGQPKTRKQIKTARSSIGHNDPEEIPSETESDLSGCEDI